MPQQHTPCQCHDGITEPGKTRNICQACAACRMTPPAAGTPPKAADMPGRVMEMGPLEHLFPCARSKILDFLTIFDTYEYPAADIARCSGVSQKAALRELGALEAESLVIRAGAPGGGAMYRLNRDSETVQDIDRFATRFAIRKYKENRPF